MKTPRGRTRWLLGLALVLLGAAATDPAVTLERPVYDAVVVLDVSQSMNVADYRVAGRPVTRLAYAKAALRHALLELPCGSRIGFGLFAAYRVLLLSAPAEVCANYADLTALLDRIDNRLAWTNASEVRKGLFNGVEAAHALPERPALVFVTDGDEAPPIDPNVMLWLHAPQARVAGTLVGVGADTPQPIPMTAPDGWRLGFWGVRGPVREGDPGEIRSALQEKHLRALAREVDFDYRRLESTDDFAEVLARPAFARRQPTRVRLAPFLGGLAFAAVLAVFLAPLARRRRPPAARR